MYNWIETTFNVSQGLAQGLALIISLAVVLVLFGLFVFIIKRLMGANAPQNRGRQPRIAIMDSTTVDTRRRLLLVRRDNVEHLILVGGPSDVVVEQNIIRHTPLASGQLRTGAFAGHTQGSTASKPHLAPGPEIPPTPEDNDITQHTSGTAPAQAAPPANTTISITAKKQEISVAPKAPIEAKQVQQPRFASPPTPPKPIEQNLQPSAAPIQSSPDPKKYSKPNPATSLVRAAAKNGLAPKPQTPANQQESSKSPVSSENDEPSKTPEFKTAAAASEMAPVSSLPSKTGTAFRSLSKSFSPKERPSYGGQKISPPASGPAARAKTVLSKPVDAEAVASPEQPSGNGEQEQSVSKHPVSTASKDSTPSTQNETPVEPTTTTTPVANPSAENTTPPESNLEAALKESIAENRLTKEGTSDTTKASEEKAEVAVAEKASGAQTENKKTLSQMETAPNAPQEPADTLAKQGSDEPHGLGDRNPIEEEMAKILDEVGGQPKQ
ncbi:MAG: hypothetical protein ABJN98_07630 [Roseibium sp.]